MPLADEFAAFADLLRRSTVQVRSGNRGAGSGVIWQPDGLIITNAHVAHGSGATVQLWDGRVFEARVTARDPQRDLAALEVAATDLPAATVADSDVLRVGQLVAAVGNPFGLAGALTLGIIHAIAPSEGHGARTWVQADVRLAPGNSGGPLADVQGRVVGINSMIAGGLGLAVPSNAVQLFLQQGSHRPRLGVTMQPVLVPLGYERRPGFLLLEVAGGSPAEKAGLLVGDIVIGVAGRLFGTPSEFGGTLQRLVPGEEIQLELLRGGTRITRHVVLAAGNGAERDEGAAA
jgi:serine protease Do